VIKKVVFCKIMSGSSHMKIYLLHSCKRLDFRVMIMKMGITHTIQALQREMADGKSLATCKQSKPRAKVILAYRLRAFFYNFFGEESWASKGPKPSKV